MEHLVDLGERAGELERDTGPEGDGEHTNVRAGGIGVLVERVVCPGRNLAGASRDREHDRLARRTLRAAVRAHELRVPACSAEERRRHSAREAERSRVAVVERGHPLAESRIELVAKLIAREEVPGKRGERDRHGQRGRRGQREARSQAHGSRNA